MRTTKPWNRPSVKDGDSQHAPLASQRCLWVNMYVCGCGRVRHLQVGSRFPVVNGLLNAIRRKKSKDTLVLSGVIAACILFTIIYVMAK